MKSEDKRKYLRLNAFLEGTFEAEDGTQGLIMLMNFSKQGLKVSLNRHVGPGKSVEIEVRIPGSIIPVSAVLKIIWIKKSGKEWTYSYDAGTKFTAINETDRQRLVDFAFEHWRAAKGKA